MALAVLYGVYSLFFSASPKVARTSAAKSISEINKFVADVATSLKEDYTKRGLFIIAQAKGEWTKDPFWILKAPQKTAIELDKSPATAVAAPEKRFLYSGYIQMGDLKLVIINGIEYELGNELEGGDHVVKQIEPLRVLIGPPDSNDNITLLLDETSRQTR